MSPGRFLILLLVPLLTVVASPQAHADPPEPPPEFQSLYTELSQNLGAFDAQIDAEWNGGVGSGRLSAGLATANGNKTVGLLNATNWTRTMEMLDAFEQMGVELVKIDIQYPLFTPAFHSYLAANDPPLIPNYTLTVDYWVGQPASFYNKVVDELRVRGLDIWIEHSTLFSELNATPAAPYFADMRTAGVAATRERYMQERIAELVLIASELNPDYYTLIDEPTTQNANFGFFPGNVPILTPDGWRDLAQDGADEILSTLPGNSMLLGSGSGTWESRAYTERFAALTLLDYVDFHHYPFASTVENYNQNLLDWTDYVRGVDPSKKITLGESWLYKASIAEVSGGLSAYETFGRDVYSFWESLDSQYLDVMFKIMHHKGFEASMPFWTQYFFLYVDHGDPALDDLEGMELVGYAANQAVSNIQSVILNSTGQQFATLLAAAQHADADGTPDHQDTGDSDGDLLADNVEVACGSRANDSSVRPERTDAEFTSISDDGDAAVDEALPANLGGFDCDGDGFTGDAEDSVHGVLNRGDQDACGTNGWPAELNPGAGSQNRISLADIGAFFSPVVYFNSLVGSNPGDQRYDLIPGGTGFHINVQDIGALLAGPTSMPAMLGGSMAVFNGPDCPWVP
jgi:hypothetical protein